MKDKKSAVFQCGKKLFVSRGFKDTNVSEITEMAGIGVGTFYNYYSSKEELFLDIYQEEMERLKKRILESVNLDDEPVTLAKAVSSQFFSGVNSNPILKEWHERNLYLKLDPSDREKITKKEEDFYYKFWAELIKKWQSEGKARKDIDHELMIAFFISLAYVNAHKAEIGPQFFPMILDYLVEFIVGSLVD